MGNLISFISVLVFSDTVNHHSVVVGSFPVVECHLAHFLSDVNFRMWFGCHYLTFVGSGQASPTGHIRTGKFRFFVYIRHYGNTVTGETLVR